MTAKEQVISSVKLWVDDKVDSMTASNPRMSVLAPRIKQGMGNMISKYEDSIDNVMLFFTDKEGNLDVGNFFEEGMKMFEELPVTHKKMMGIDIAIGKGEIVATPPDNFFTSLLMGNTGAVKLTTEDFIELKDLILNSK